MSASRQKRIQIIKDRAFYLRKRINEAAKEGRDLTYDKAEMRALEWAVPILEGNVEASKILHQQLREEKEERDVVD